MQIRKIRGIDELAVLAEVAAPLQARHDAHIAYLAVEADGILAELSEATWSDVSAVVVDDADVVTGWLVGDVDPEMGRVWWLGPFVTAGVWEEVASGLLAAGRAQLGDGVTEEEMAVDSEFGRCRSWAPNHGFAEEEGSLALVLERSIESASVAIREIEDSDHDLVAVLHDELFPGTHTTGRDLVSGQDQVRRRLVVETGGGVAGYIAVERQPDGSGYIDYLGVAPAARRRGLGAELVRAGVQELRRLESTSVALTVRVGSEGARELYASLGFREERVLVPLRRGFSLA